MEMEMKMKVNKVGFIRFEQDEMGGFRRQKEYVCYAGMYRDLFSENR